jgi:transcriptional regulator with XRE-family HTH domain
MARRDLGGKASLTRDLGSRLRLAREDRGISLRSLADRVEVSPSLLSQIENGLARPSVGTLWAVVDALGVSLDRIFDVAAPPATTGGPQAPAVQRVGDRQVLELSGGVRWERLDASHDPDVVFAFVTYEPGVASDHRPRAQHSGREYGFMVSGRLAIEVDDHRVEVGPGDAVSFSSQRPHRFSAVGDEPARAVWFNLTR